MSNAKKLVAMALINGHKSRKVVCDSKDVLIGLSAIRMARTLVGGHDEFAETMLSQAQNGLEAALGHREVEDDSG